MVLCVGVVRTTAVSCDRERGARMRDYVEKNADLVHSSTTGEVGYVHIPVRIKLSSRSAAISNLCN